MTKNWILRRMVKWSTSQNLVSGRNLCRAQSVMACSQIHRSLTGGTKSTPAWGCRTRRLVAEFMDPLRESKSLLKVGLKRGMSKAVSETTNRQIESVNWQRESVATLVFFSNLVIDDNFRISNNLGLGLAANISAALAIQPVRDREIEII